MKINLNEPNPGVFFRWPNAKTDEEGGITLRALNIEALTAIDDATTTKKKKFRGHTPYDDVKVDEKRREELIWDYCIVDWENLQDENGKDIPCTLENKVMLMRTQFQFSVFVADCLDQLTEFAEGQKETELKNSLKS